MRKVRSLSGKLLGIAEKNIAYDPFMHCELKHIICLTFVLIQFLCSFCLSKWRAVGDTSITKIGFFHAL